VALPDGAPDRDSIDAVIFDAGGVLLLPEAMIGQAAVRALNCDPRLQDWPMAYYTANLLLDSVEGSDWLGTRRAMASTVGVPDDQLDSAIPLIERLIASAPWVPVEGAVDLLSSLAVAGYQLAVVSNAFGTVQRQLEDLRVCSLVGEGMPRVGAVIDSRVVGVEKPDPRIFHLALEALGVEASRSVYIGDTVKFDVLGAQGAGLHAIHFDPFHLCNGDHSHVSGHDELGAWLVQT
jgi:putative hydrolase of the HAD superfamily